MNLGRGKKINHATHAAAAAAAAAAPAATSRPCNTLLCGTLPAWHVPSRQDSQLGCPAMIPLPPAAAGLPPGQPYAERPGEARQ